MSLIAWNEISPNSNGGTEQCARWLESQLEEEYGSKFQITPSRIRNLDMNRYRVYWLHDLPWDPETNHLKDKTSRERFHRLVFCGNWQRTMYQAILGVELDERSVVIDTPLKPIDCNVHDKNYDTINLIYTSTPQRGLDILIPVFVELAKQKPNIHLHVFSSFQIYGWADADSQFEPLYKICREHPQITYHGAQPNEVVREHLKKSHILAYPSTWLECNSRSLIEAMSASVLCVHSDYGGLMDTSGGLTVSYPYYADKNKHAEIFYRHLSAAIQTIQDEQLINRVGFTKVYADSRFNEESILHKWKWHLKMIEEEYHGQGLVPPNDQVAEFKL